MPEPTALAPFSLAVDAMGGDDAPAMVVAGLALAAERHPGARFLLVGDEAQLAPLLASHPRARATCTIRHASEMVSGDMKPTVALRMRASSMRVAIDAVANGEAVGLVSAGNTGALHGAGQDRHQDPAGHRPPGHGGDRALRTRRCRDARPRRQCRLRQPQPRRIRRDGGDVRPHRARHPRTHDRPAQCGIGGAEGGRSSAPRGRCAAREPYRRALSRLRRGA